MDTVERIIKATRMREGFAELIEAVVANARESLPSDPALDAVIARSMTEASPELDNFVQHLAKKYVEALGPHVAASLEFFESPAGQCWIGAIDNVEEEMFDRASTYARALTSRIAENYSNHCARLLGQS